MDPNSPCYGQSDASPSYSCLSALWPNLFQPAMYQQPSCTISVASSGTPINGQNLVGLATYSPSTNALGAYSTVGRPGAPQGWFFAVQIQATLVGDTDPADWSGAQTVYTSGGVQIRLPNGTASTYIWPHGSPQDDTPNPRAVATGVGYYDWLDAPGFPNSGFGGVPVGGTVVDTFTSTLMNAQTGATCSVTWSVSFTFSPRGATSKFSQ